MHIHLYFTSEELYSVRNAQMGLSIHHQTEGAVMDKGWKSALRELDDQILSLPLEKRSHDVVEEWRELLRQEWDLVKHVFQTTTNPEERKQLLIGVVRRVTQDRITARTENEWRAGEEVGHQPTILEIVRFHLPMAKKFAERYEVHVDI